MFTNTVLVHMQDFSHLVAITYICNAMGTPQCVRALVFEIPGVEWKAFSIFLQYGQIHPIRSRRHPFSKLISTFLVPRLLLR